MNVADWNTDNKKKSEFDKEKAKKTQASILDEIFDLRLGGLNQSSAAKLIEKNRSVISRARKGESLLYAEGLVKILTKAHSLKSAHEVAIHIKGCSHLDQYLENELGNMYSDPSFKRNKNGQTLTASIVDLISYDIYTYLYNYKKKVNKDFFYKRHGVPHTERAFHKLAENNIIIDYGAIGVVQIMNQEFDLSVDFFKNQVKNVANKVNDLDVILKKQICRWDSVLVTSENGKEIYNDFVEFGDKIKKKINRFERNGDISKRTCKVDYAFVYSREKTDEREDQGKINTVDTIQ